MFIKLCSQSGHTGAKKGQLRKLRPRFFNSRHFASKCHIRHIARASQWQSTISQARVFIPPRTTAKTLVAAGHVGLQEFVA